MIKINVNVCKQLRMVTVVNNLWNFDTTLNYTLYLMFL